MARMALSSLAMYTVSPRSPTTMLRSFSLSFKASMPPVKPTKMEKGPVISIPPKAARRYVMRAFSFSSMRPMVLQKGAAMTLAASS